MFGQEWWHSPLIPAHGRQRSVDPCEFKSTLVYIISSRQSGIYRKTLSQRAKRKEKSWSEPQSNEWKEFGADPNKIEHHILSLPLKNFFYGLFQTWSHIAALAGFQLIHKAGFKLLILLPSCPQCWDFSFALQHPVLLTTLKSRVSCLSSECQFLTIKHKKLLRDPIETKLYFLELSDTSESVHRIPTNGKHFLIVSRYQLTLFQNAHTNPILQLITLRH